jgi:hypothetical protein
MAYINEIVTEADEGYVTSWQNDDLGLLKPKNPAGSSKIQFRSDG